MPAKRRKATVPVPPELTLRTHEAPCLFVTYDEQTGKPVQIAAADGFVSARPDVRATVLWHLIGHLQARLRQAVVEMGEEKDEEQGRA